MIPIVSDDIGIGQRVTFTRSRGVTGLIDDQKEIPLSLEELRPQLEVTDVVPSQLRTAVLS